MHGSIILMSFALFLYSCVAYSCVAAETLPKERDLMSPSQSTKEAQVSLGRDSGTAKVGTGSAGAGDLTLTILYDNKAYDPRTAADKGFAALIELSGHRLLFDTGAKGRVLLFNMKVLGVEPRSLEAVILSHEHGDHIGGLVALLNDGARPTVYVPASFSASVKERISQRAKIVEVSRPLELLPGIHATGPMGKVGEQSLAIRTGSGVVVITGCAHPGVATIVKRVSQILPGTPFLLAGGFHLQTAATDFLRTSATELKRSGVVSVMPMHCTGEKAGALFKSLFGEHGIEGGTGRKVIVK